MRTSALLVRGDMSVDLRLAWLRKVRQSKGERRGRETGRQKDRRQRDKETGRQGVRVTKDKEAGGRMQVLRCVLDPYLHGTPPFAPSVN